MQKKKKKLYCFSKLCICYKSLSLLLVPTWWYVFFWIPLCFYGIISFLLSTYTIDFDLFYQVLINHQITLERALWITVLNVTEVDPEPLVIINIVILLDINKRIT